MESESVDSTAAMDDGDISMNAVSQSERDEWSDPPKNVEDFLKDVQEFHNVRG